MGTLSLWPAPCGHKCVWKEGETYRPLVYPVVSHNYLHALFTHYPVKRLAIRFVVQIYQDSSSFLLRWRQPLRQPRGEKHQPHRFPAQPPGGFAGYQQIKWAPGPHWAYYAVSCRLQFLKIEITFTISKYWNNIEIHGFFDDPSAKTLRPPVPVRFYIFQSEDYARRFSKCCRRNNAAADSSVAWSPCLLKQSLLESLALAADRQAFHTLVSGLDLHLRPHSRTVSKKAWAKLPSSVISYWLARLATAEGRTRVSWTTPTYCPPEKSCNFDVSVDLFFYISYISCIHQKFLFSGN